MKGQVFGIGETVYDIIFKDNQPQRAVPGGSTFNALVSLGRLGVPCSMVTEVGDPSWYTAEIELSGMLMSEYDETCESITQSLESAGGKVKCSGSGIRGELKLPAITNPVKVQSVVSETIEEGKEKCDNLFNTYKKVFAGFDGAWDYGESTVNVEKAQSCDVNFANDTVYLNVIYSSKSLVMKTTLDNPVTFHTTEEYTGLDDETLVQICDAHLHDEDIKRTYQHR